ncbi:MAG TPA: 3'-5' exonuclease [Pirellulales bacterium]|jgi:DNA polymerase III epsilon subunit-like protein|nr:3'-5' exonuclease [Pirellulales bacterium]
MEAGNRRLVFFDLECAGLDPKRHPIIQIAAIAVDEALEPIEAFEAKLRFDVQRANKNSLRKNHYHPGIWAKEGREPEEIARTFAEFLRRHATIPMMGATGSSYAVAQLVAHNADFDGSFLQAWYERFGVYLPARRQVLCTLQRAMWFFSEQTRQSPKDFKLATLCHFFAVPFHAASAHEALGDVLATIQLYKSIFRAVSSPLCQAA